MEKSFDLQFYLQAWEIPEKLSASFGLMQIPRCRQNQPYLLIRLPKSALTKKDNGQKVSNLPNVIKPSSDTETQHQEVSSIQTDLQNPIQKFQPSQPNAKEASAHIEQGTCPNSNLPHLSSRDQCSLNQQAKSGSNPGIEHSSLLDNILPSLQSLMEKAAHISLPKAKSGCQHREEELAPLPERNKSLQNQSRGESWNPQCTRHFCSVFFRSFFAVRLL